MGPYSIYANLVGVEAVGIRPEGMGVPGIRPEGVGVPGIRPEGVGVPGTRPEGVEGGTRPAEEAAVGRSSSPGPGGWGEVVRVGVVRVGVVKVGAVRVGVEMVGVVKLELLEGEVGGPGAVALALCVCVCVCVFITTGSTCSADRLHIVCSKWSYSAALSCLAGTVALLQPETRPAGWLWSSEGLWRREGGRGRGRRRGREGGREGGKGT